MLCFEAAFAMMLGGDSSAYKRRKPLVSTAVPSKIKAIVGFIIRCFCW